MVLPRKNKKPAAPPRKLKEEIAGIASDYGIPREEALSIARTFGLGEIDQEVPPELFRAVAEVMAFVYQIDQLSENTQEMKRKK